MKNALAATRAALTWLVLTACLVTAGLVTAVPADAATRTYTASAAAEVHASPAATAAVLGTLAKGAHVLPKAAAKSGWLPIAYAATTGYVATSAVKVDKKAASSVTTGPAGKKAATVTVNLRASASLNADILAVAKKSSVLKVTGVTSGTFTQVTYGDKTSWVYSEFLTPTTDTTPDVVATYSTIASLALRETGVVTAKNLGTIAKGAKVSGTGVHSRSYSQVIYKGKVGWVITGYLKAAKGTAAALVLPIRKSTRYAMVADTVIRADADAASDQVTTLAAAEAVRTTGTVKKDFTQIIWDGATKWVATISLAITKPTADGFIDLGSSSLNKLEPYGKAAVIAIRAAFPEIKTIYGWRASSAYSSDHPSGRATDNMIPDYKKNKALGDAVAAWAIAHGKELHITYLIWRQRSYTISRGSWKSMADRGSDNANHMNHVHISFEPS
ncbi:MAG TPA: SH3 domain-containing protein [Propionicimonas sp.]